MTKHEIMKAYLEPKIIEIADTVLHFNFSPESPDSISIITRYSDHVVRRFITDEAEKEYGFSVIIVKAYSQDTDDVNIEAMNFAQAFMDWLDEQNAAKNFPDFGEGTEVLSIDNLQNMPNLSGISQDGSLARYQVQGRVLYREKAN